MVIFSLFGQMESTCALERATHAQAVGTAKGRRVGRPRVVYPDKLSYAEHLHTEGLSIREIVEKKNVTCTTLHRCLPRPVTPTPPKGKTSTLLMMSEHGF